MSMMTAIVDGLTTLTLNPEHNLQQFQTEQAHRDRLIQQDLSKRLSLALALEYLKNHSEQS